MLKASFDTKLDTIHFAVKYYRSNGGLGIKYVGNSISGSAMVVGMNQAVMAIIGVMADMGNDDLVSVSRISDDWCETKEAV